MRITTVTQTAHTAGDRAADLIPLADLEIAALASWADGSAQGPWREILGLGPLVAATDTAASWAMSGLASLALRGWCDLDEDGAPLPRRILTDIVRMVVSAPRWVVVEPIIDRPIAPILRAIPNDAPDTSRACVAVSPIGPSVWGFAPSAATDVPSAIHDAGRAALDAVEAAREASGASTGEPTTVDLRIHLDGNGSTTTVTASFTDGILVRIDGVDVTATATDAKTSAEAIAAALSA